MHVVCIHTWYTCVEEYDSLMGIYQAHRFIIIETCIETTMHRAEPLYYVALHHCCCVGTAAHNVSVKFVQTEPVFFLYTSPLADLCAFKYSKAAERVHLLAVHILQHLLRELARSPLTRPQYRAQKQPTGVRLSAFVSLTTRLQR
jgi:hypothetical protein